MINKIIHFSVYRPFMVLLLTVLFTALGWFAYLNLPIDAVPDITNVQIIVNTKIDGMTPDTIETNVTFPIETALNSVPGAEQVRSITKIGLSQVTVIFAENTDLYLARQLVSEKLQTLELPIGAQPEMGPVSTGLGEIYHYQVEMKRPATEETDRLAQLMRLRTLQEWTVKPMLLNVKGVTEVNTVGGFAQQYFIKPDIKLMARYGIHYNEIVEAIAKNSFNEGGGYISQSAEQLLVQAVGYLRHTDEIKIIPVKRLQNLTTITIGDIASVGLDKELRYGAAVVNGKEGIVGTVFMLLGANSRTVSLDVDKKINEIRDILPSDVIIKTLYNRSTLVNDTLETVQKNLAYGALLVIIILFLLVGDIRAALITSLVIPLSLLGTFILMNLAGIPGSLMSLGALDFGIIIDGAVIVMDACSRSVSEKIMDRPLHRHQVKEIVASSTIAIRRAAGFGQLIIVMVFIPTLALSGVEGKMFRPMALAFAFALLTAFVFSFTTVPALAGLILSGRKKSRVPWLMRAFQFVFDRSLVVVLRFRWYFLTTALLLVVYAFYLFSQMGSEFMPTLEEKSFAIQIVRPVNISLEQSVVFEEKMQKEIMKFSEVKNIFGRLGTSEVSVDPMGYNISDQYIMLKDDQDWPLINGHKRTIDELRVDIMDLIKMTIPGQRVMLSQPIQLRFNELLEGVKSDISLMVFGKDLEQLEELSEEIEDKLKGIPGIAEIEVEMQGKSPILRIYPKMEVVNAYGIDKGRLMESIGVAVAGKQAGFVYEGVIKYPIIVRSTDYDRENLHQLEKMPIGIEPGFTLPLAELADFRIEKMYTTIKRVNTERRGAILINLSNRDTGSFVAQAKTALDLDVELPSGYYLTWGGNFKNLESAQKKLFILVPIVLLVIFIMVNVAFGNLIQTIIVFMSVPFAMVGGILNLYLLSLPFSISAGIGFIAVSGISVLNGLILIGYINTLKQEGLSGEELVKTGAKLRLRAVLMTALSDILGFLPMMLSSGTGADVQRPLAAVVVGGIFSASLMTLFIMPILYNLTEKFMNKYLRPQL